MVRESRVGLIYSISSPYLDTFLFYNYIIQRIITVIFIFEEIHTVLTIKDIIISIRMWDENNILI